METAAMGKVLVRAKIENLYDIERREQGELPAEQVRSVEVADALVDTGGREVGGIALEVLTRAGWVG